MFYEKATRKTLSCLLAYFNREIVRASESCANIECILLVVRTANCEQNQSAGEHLQFDGMEQCKCTVPSALAPERWPLDNDGDDS